MEKTAILALTPSVVSLKSQALRPKTTGRMLFSLNYSNIRIKRFMQRIFLSSSFVKERINTVSD
jgi:hypothetical protein